MVETFPESLLQQDAISYQLEQPKWGQRLSRLMKKIWAFSESNLVYVTKDF